MRITGVDTILVDVSSDAGRPADETRPGWRDFPTLLVRVDTDEGLSGWGEAYGYGIAPATKVAIDEVLAPLLTGSDPADIAGIGHRLNRLLHYYGRNGPFSFGLSGIDIALWDLAGKVAGLPLHRLLGGAARTAVEVYASLVGYGDAATVAERACEAVAAGYRQVKLHEREPSHVEAVRAATGSEVGLMLDLNCAWTLEQALRAADRLRPLDLRWVEDAVWPPEDHAALARLRAAGLRISAGENVATLFDFRHLFELGALDVAQPDVTKIGGVTEMRKVAALAEAHGVTLSPHCAGFGPGFLASLHVLASLPEASVLERVYVKLDAAPLAVCTVTVGGAVPVPNGPGLGADPDPDVIRLHRRPG
jgi:L-alanine-DL-glutamate epimerase-like enolase superfamily enzyme